MIVWMSTLGLLSSFALGPASFHIVHRLLGKKVWPWDSIAGFLLGELFYICSALVLLQSSLLHAQWLKTTFTLLTVAFLSFYSVKMLWFSKKSPLPQQVKPSPRGFTQTLLLTLGNFHLLFIYAGLFLNLDQNTNTLVFGAAIYALSSILGFLSLLWVLSHLRQHLHKFLRKAEVLAACGFLGFSLYLVLETL